jgi:hypothetical protein
MKTKAAQRKEPAGKSKAPTASGIAIFCAFTKIVPATQLIPHPKNPKKHPTKQLDRYERVVVGNGWRRAIVVSARSGFITKGHGAWQMASRRGWDVPIEIQSYKNSAEEIRDLLADNHLAELGETDDTILSALLSELPADDVVLAGFNESELRELLGEEEKEEKMLVPIDASFEVVVECPNETEQKRLFERFNKEGLKCRVLTL